ncbi:MAG: hypothetical protein GOVbin631_61 [Prokaryotic dsDNA virus sp.]|nr:MAG: hypothetical protein GOVbin631_61 [Prokaryotic dsDNA virus sp.]|tara:strand:- start:24416 stop:24568 length:153 start_codon:yes stop_codon:yes gene_type:complete
MIWEGGFQPVFDDISVNVTFRNGDVVSCWSDDLDWDHSGDEWDVVDYEVE